MVDSRARKRPQPRSRRSAQATETLQDGGEDRVDVGIQGDGDGWAVGAGANAAVPAVSPPAADVVLVSTEIAADAVRSAVRAAGRCVLNPAPVVDAVLDVLDAGPILTPNRSECLDLAARLGGPGGGDSGEDVVAAARWVQERTGAPVVVTLGGDGALVVEGGTVDRVAARPATVRDTTGAGDTFNGVLAVRLAAGDPLGAAVRAAVVAASLSVTRVGARAGMPTAAEITAAEVAAG